MTSGPAIAACLLVTGLVAGAVATGGSVVRNSSDRSPAWTKTEWPFSFDPWGPGRGFRCDRSSCEADLRAYVRAKVGFCNCTTGVADDDEIDRVGDIDLVGSAYAPLAPGRPVALGPLRGRARLFAVRTEGQPERYVIGIAVSKKCDVVVGTVVSDRPIGTVIEQEVLEFLSRAEVVRWAETLVGS